MYTINLTSGFIALVMTLIAPPTLAYSLRSFAVC